MNSQETSSGVPVAGRNASDDERPPSPASNVAQVALDASKTTSNYANFCRLSGTPEELIIDFGLHSPFASSAPEATEPIVVSQRIVTGWHTAKRLVSVLQLTVERHEAAFGVLETDVQRRMGRS